MPKFKVTYEGCCLGPADGDCYYDEDFHGTVEESAIIDAIDEKEANEKAKILAY